MNAWFQSVRGPAKWAVFLLGVAFFAVLVSIVASETKLFLDSKYWGFWAEVEAYHLNPAGRKPVKDLVARYGDGPVERYVTKPTLNAAYLPSEEAARVNVVAYVISQNELLAAEKHKPGAGVVTPFSAFLVSILVIYVTIVLAARRTQEWATSRLCRSREARAARDEYFASVREKGTRQAIAVAFLVAMVMSVGGAMVKLTPEMRGRGMTVLDLAGALLWLGYMSGLWMLLVSYVVDVGLLASGRNPHLSLWDEVVALGLMVPVLLIVYQNSLAATLTGAVTGLAGGAYAKWSARKRAKAA